MEEIVVCANCKESYTDEEKVNGLPVICPRCENGRPTEDNSIKPEAVFLWSRSTGEKL